MLNPDVAERIRAIFLHDGRPVTIVDVILLLGWQIAEFERAVKWKVVTLDASGDVPLVPHAQLVALAREQWSELEIAEALGDDAPRFLPPPAAVPSAVAQGCDRDAAAATQDDSPQALVHDHGSASDVGVSVPVAAAPLRPHVPHVPESPAKRRRRLAALRSAAPQPIALPPPRRNRNDGVREATMIQTCAGDNGSAPHLRLRGYWLSRFGFKPATRIYITPSPGQLVITLRDPATSTKSATSPACVVKSA